MITRAWIPAAAIVLVACSSAQGGPGDACGSNADCREGTLCGGWITSDGVPGDTRECMELCPAGVPIFGRCSTGEACFPARDIAETDDTTAGICFRGGETPRFLRCEYELECERGFACTTDAIGASCRPTCNTSTDCGPGETCSDGGCIDSAP